VNGKIAPSPAERVVSSDELAAADLREDPLIYTEQQVSVRAEMFIGPLPHPDILKRYDEVMPGIADRIVAEFQAESLHRREQEKAALHAESREAMRGQLFAFLTVVAAFITVGWLGWLGHPAAAGAVAGTTIVGLVIAFIQGRKQPTVPPQDNAVQPSSSAPQKKRKK